MTNASPYFSLFIFGLYDLLTERVVALSDGLDPASVQGSQVPQVGDAATGKALRQLLAWEVRSWE